uniref:Timeless C-terminal domain-containing protein n=1 Tax=Musca domestica TaxID=7370 RepID=A0A1I8N7D7_MUSDO
MLLNNVCYVLEYRETILHLLMNYNETHSTKAFLRDVVETANIFIKMMEKFCKDSVVVQDKKRSKKRSNKKSKKSDKPKQETEEELSNKWAEMAGELSQLLATELQIPEEDQPIPFDSASDVPIDDQKEDCMIRIHKMLRTGKLDHAIALMRAAREVWPENDVFGAMSAAPEDELLLMREIFMHNITTVEPEENNENESDSGEDEENEEIEDNHVVEKTFKFDDFAKRLLNPKIVRACVVVLTDWEKIPTKSLKAAVTILHRIAYGCSCPAMLYQAKLFRIFQEVMNAGRDAHHEELRRLGTYVVRKFVETAPNNPKIYAELLFYKSVKEANEVESGYCDAYESGTKGTWTDEQEAELRFLFEENQRNPETDKDVIDWILDNIIDKTRTRRGVLKKLKEMGLTFKAPTKKSTASAQSKHLWKPEEDEELRSLYDQYRTEDDCLQRILSEFEERRNKQQIIKRMLQLHIIADKSEILPQKPRKRKSKKKNSDDDEENDEFMQEEGGMSERAKSSSSSSKPSKSRKPAKSQKRKIVRTPLDVGTVRALLGQIDADKYQESIDWLKECLDDAADDEDEPSEEDDGVPLLPLQPQQKEAMEDDNFKKVLVALGIQPPVLGMETYWRIPTYLNSADLKLRAKIVAGEEVEIDVEGIEEDDDEESDNADDAGDDNGSESEDDYLESLANAKDREKLDNLEKIRDQQRSKLNNLMFSKSDEETEERAPLQAKKKPKTKKETQKKKKKPAKSDDSDDEDPELVNKIKKKLDKKRRNYDLSSEEDNSDAEDTFKMPAEKEVEKPNTVDLFDQLKAKRASSKIKLSDMVDEKKTAAKNNATEDDDENDDLNFNSEDYRKRLAELGDDDDDDDDNEDGGVEEQEKTIINRSRRANVIESDDDDDDTNKKGNPDENATKKRRRSVDADGEETDKDEEDEDAMFLSRKKPSAAEKLAAESGEEPAKRRRLAIVDDDDEDDY